MPNADPKPLRTPREHQVGKDLAAVFEASKDPIETRIESFPRYFRRQHATRFMALYEVFKRVLAVKGSVVDCGVNRGFSLMSWAKFSAVLEPNNLTRQIYGFDSFSGFPSVNDKDIGKSAVQRASAGQLASDSYDELLKLIEIFDRDRFLGHIPKVHLIPGDATSTIPTFVAENPHLVVSLLFMDFDLYEPTRVALEQFVPRMPKGAVIAFDELDNPIWPGETAAALETVGIRSLELRRLHFDPYVAFARIP